MSINSEVGSLNKVAIIYTHVDRKDYFTEEQYIADKDADKAAQTIADELIKLNLEVILIPGNDSMVDELNKHKPDMAFNLVDSVKGYEYLCSTIPGLLDMMYVPFTGTGLLGMAICCNKFLTKQLLDSARVPVPNFQLVHSHTDTLNTTLRFPLISKLNSMHGAVEINDNAVSENEKHLKERIAYLVKTYEQSVLVEEFITGREITAFVLQGVVTKVYMAEKIFNKPDEKYIFATFEDQWLYEDDEAKHKDAYHYEKYDDPVLKDYVKKSFETTDMLDYAKFDIRMDASGRYYFIDSNANPSFGPLSMGTSMGYIIQQLYGVPFLEILKRLINNTMGGKYFSESVQNNGD